MDADSRLFDGRLFSIILMKIETVPADVSPFADSAVMTLMQLNYFINHLYGA